MEAKQSITTPRRDNGKVWPGISKFSMFLCLCYQGWEVSDLSTHSRCEWKNSHRGVGFFPKFLEQYMDFWCRKKLPMRTSAASPLE